MVKKYAQYPISNIALRHCSPVPEAHRMSACSELGGRLFGVSPIPMCTCFRMERSKRKTTKPSGTIYSQFNEPCQDIEGMKDERSERGPERTSNAFKSGQKK